ncbi:MAG: Ig-like domain-containing protein [Planctomycetota bacterium]
MTVATSVVRWGRWCGAAGVLAGLAAAPASAVVPERFVHTTEADFEPGEFEGTAITTLGDLELAPTTALLAELPAEYTVVYDVVELEGVTYVAAGPEGAVFKVVEAAEDEDAEDADAETTEGEEQETEDEAETPAMTVEQVLDLPGEQVFDLIAAEGMVIAAVSSNDDARIIKLDLTGGDGHESVMSLPGVRYVWSVLYLPEAGATLAATGTDGQVVRLDASGDEPVVEVVVDTAQANVLTLAGTPDADGKPGFPVYAGTDTDGIIYRIDEGGSSRPIYDAAEPEVATLVVAADGTLYAGTADANQAKPGRMDGANEDETGRPDGETLEGEAADEIIADDEPGLPDLPPDADPMDADAEAESEANADASEEATEDTAAEQVAASEDAEAPAEVEAVDEPADATPEGEPVEEAEADLEVTPEQYDALREEVKRRLADAAKGGKLAAGGSKSASKPKATRARTPGKPEASKKEGNAVYRISPDGLVTEAFRETVMVLGLHLDESTPSGRLLIATGSEGQVYEVKLATRESAVITDLDAEQVYRIAHSSDATPILATANPATLRKLSESGDEGGGTYTSAPLDAEQISLWGKLLVALDRGDAEGFSVETRTGAVADPESAVWSPWEAATRVSADPTSGLAMHEVSSPPARFIQYRLSLNANDASAVDRVELAYVRPNLAPNVSSFTAAYGDTPEDPDEATPTVVNLEWEAEDPNGDRMRYEVHAKPVSFDGTDRGWLTVTDDLDENSFEWDTKTMPDGRYVLRVVAHDRLDNPAGSARAGSRRSAPLVVDNTPPALELGETAAASTTARGAFSGTATDATSPLLSVDFRLADDQPWRPALPDDLIYDSTTEAFTFTLPRLAKGGYVLSVRARDTRGNVTYASRFLTVE